MIKPFKAILITVPKGIKYCRPTLVWNKPTKEELRLARSCGQEYIEVLITPIIKNEKTHIHNKR
jgi:hypothetical protein